MILMDEIKEFVNEFIAKYDIDESDKIKATDKIKLQEYIERHGDIVKESFAEYGHELKDLNLYDWLGFKNEKSWQEWKRKYVDLLYAEDVIESITFYPSVRVDVKKLEFEKRVDAFIDGYIKLDKPYRLYRARLSMGGKDIFIIIDRYQYLKIENDQTLYLRKCKEEKIRKLFKINRDEDKDLTDEARLLSIICGEYFITDPRGYPKDFDERLDKLIEKHSQESIFFELAAPVKKEDLMKLGLSDVIWQALDAGLNKDEKLLTIMRMHIPIVVPNLELITPAEYMEYAPHTIMITSSKPGKTTTAEKIGNVLDRPTVTHLLGSASLHEKIHGMLNMQIKPTIYDGIEEFKDEDIARGMLNYMEKGKAIIARGKGVKTEGYSTLLFFSNPESGKEYARSMESLLTLLHTNLLGFGSRIGLFIFDPEMKEPSGDAIPSELEERYNKIIEATQFYSMHIFTKILKNERIKRWLRSKDGIIMEYIARLDEILNDESMILHDKLATFINGLKRGWKHVKGGALRLSFMDLIRDFLEIEENKIIPNAYIILLLNKAQEYLKEIVNLNLLSFTHISEFRKDELMETLLESRLGRVKNMCREYEIFLFWILAKYTKDNDAEKDIALPLSTLKDLYLEIPGDMRLNSRYNSFSKFSSTIEENWKKINSHRRWLGFHLENIDGEILCRLEDIEWLKYIAENCLFEFMTKTVATKTTKVNNSEIGQIGHNGLGHENEYNTKTEILNILKTKPLPHVWTLEDIAKEMEVDPTDEGRIDFLQEVLKEMTYGNMIKAIDLDFTRFGIEEVKHDPE